CPCAFRRPDRQRGRQGTGARVGREGIRLAEECKRRSRGEIEMNPAKSKADNPYVAAFEQAATFRNTEPSWLREVREASFARFNQVGYPTVNEEEWKYTN